MTPPWVRRAPVLCLAMVVLAAAVVAGFTASAAARSWLHRVDSEWLGERVMDMLTRLRSKEDWSTAQPLAPGQDYSWLKAGGSPVRIAHALGESGTPMANTLTAMRRSYQAGLRIFEVDLTLEGNELRCQHDPGVQVAVTKDGCTFETLMDSLPPDVWVVLDIKTDFANAGQRIVDRLKASDDAKRVVFQLYRPEDLVLFNEWQRQVTLPGPILTAYLSHRSIDHLAFHAARIGVRVFTLPLARVPALRARPSGMAVLVHPVHDCESRATARAWNVDGFYIQSSLHCDWTPRASAS